MALLRAVEDKPVPHLKPNAFYDAWLDGRPWCQRERMAASSRRVFQFGAEDGTLAVVDRKRRARAPTQPRAVKRRSLASLARGRFGTGSPTAQPAADASRASRSDDGDSDSSNSSNSSSSKSECEDSVSESDSNVPASRVELDSTSVVAAAASSADGMTAPPPPGPVRRMRSKGPGPSSGGSRPHGVGGVGGLVETTTFWGCYKFTLVFDSLGTATGMEATCYRPNHKAKLTCCKRFSFRAHGGEDMTVRRLRWWCILGEECASREAHRDLRLQGVPPQDDELERRLADLPWYR